MNQQMRFRSELSQSPFWRWLPSLLTILIVIFVLFAYQSWTLWAQGQSQQTNQPPARVIAYQGTLTNELGQPINESLPMTFRLYDSVDAQDALWTESYTGTAAIAIQNGQFQLWLGSQNPFPAELWNVSALYLGIQIDGDSEMRPREQLGAAPFSILSDRASTVAERSVKSAQLALQQQVKMLESATPITVTGSFSDSIGSEIPGTELIITLEKPSRILYTAQWIAHFDTPDATQTIQLVTGESATLVYQSSGQRLDTVSIVRYLDLAAGDHSIALHYQTSMPNSQLQIASDTGAGFVGYVVIDQQ